MKLARWATVAVLTLACARQSEHETTAEPARSPAVPAPPGVPWAIAYERECVGSNTVPIVSPRQTIVGLCEGVFAFADGRWLGHQPVGAHAYFDEHGVLSLSLGGLGLEVDALLDDTSVERRTLTSGRGEDLVLSADGTRALALIDDGHSKRIGVFEVPSLKALGGVAFSGYGQPRLGFRADGTPLVFAGSEASCKGAACAEKELLSPKGGRLMAAEPHFKGARDVTMARGGSRAVVERNDQSRALVDLTTGQELAALPAADDDPGPIGISDDGRRIAFVQRNTLVIAAAWEGGLAELHQMPLESADALVFSPDAKTLAVRADIGMIVIREGARPRLARPVPFDLDAPPGFRRVFFQTAPVAVAKDHPAWEELNEVMRLGTIARYRGGADDEYAVTVRVLDGTELGSPQTSVGDWSTAVMARDDLHDPGHGVLVWQTAAGRELEYARFVRESCEPMDLYVRVSERLDVVYRVEVEAPPGTPARSIAPLLERFFDAKLGAPLEARAFAQSPRPSLRAGTALEAPGD